MKATCRKCGDAYSGRIEHCPSCHRSFTGASAGDAHRTGKHGVHDGESRRRCQTDVELAKRGLTQHADGRWGYVTEGEWWTKLTPADSEPPPGDVAGAPCAGPAS